MYCKNCGKGIPENPAFCPECGASQITQAAPPATAPNVQQAPPKKKRGCLIAFLVVVAFVLVIVIVAISSEGGGTSNNDGNTPSSGAPAASSPTPSTAPKLEVVDHESISDGYWSYVTGHVKNNTNKSYSYVQIEINLYNGDTLIGSTFDNINNLGAGETWEFKAIIIEENCTSYKIMDVTGW